MISCNPDLVVRDEQLYVRLLENADGGDKVAEFTSLKKVVYVYA